MSQKPNAEPPQQPSNFDKIAVEITRHTGLNPERSSGPGAWDHFAAGVKGGLADFVGRLHGDTHTPDPEPVDKEKGMDR